jgi:hypothetical protein
MSLLGGLDKVWKFKNPWASWKYRIHRTVWCNRFVLPYICDFWVWAYKYAGRKQSYYLMRRSLWEPKA